MEYLFLSIYDFFRTHRLAYFLTFGGLLTLFLLGALQIHIEEDVTKFFPNDEKVEKINQIFQNSKFMEKLVVMVSLKDSAAGAQPDSLIAAADDLVANIEKQLEPYVKKVTYKVDDEIVLDVFNTISDHLPVFLDTNDYAAIDSLIEPDAITQTLERNYHQLISPAGLVFKRMIMKDPSGISMLAVKKLQGLQFDENFELYNGCIVTKDRKHLMFFVLPAFPPFETGNNRKLIDGLDKVIAESAARHTGIQTLYFGSTAVAVGNARQLTYDSIFTSSLIIILLVLFIAWFFKRKRAPFLILIPVIFGALFSITCINFIKGSISILAIAAGSIILGIAVNYSLHFLSHLKHSQNVRAVIKELVKPMTLGSATTILAFFCLQFANAGILRDLGLFAGFSLIGAAVCTLIFMPHLINEEIFGHQSRAENNVIDRISGFKPTYNKYIVLIIFLITPVLFYYARHVRFNSDMSKLNYMSRDLEKAEAELNKINEFSLQSVYIVASGKDPESALRVNEKAGSIIQGLKASGVIKKSSSVSSFIVSDSLQRVRIDRWNRYWTSEKKELLLRTLKTGGAKLKFTPQAFTAFDTLLNKSHHPVEISDLQSLRNNFFDDYITEKPGAVTVVTLAKVEPSERAVILQQLNQYNDIHAIDRLMLTNMFVDYVNADFNFIVAFTSILVFVVLLISYGRIELTLITFIPMLITWIWILGLMVLLGIEFNIVNVMVSTFIFGLGDDYSIFIMNGLQREYKYGRKSLSSIRTSIFLSAITTIAGLGVLILAKHPALQSIAAISILGIVCVLIMSFTLEPFLFSWLITGRTKKKLNPANLWGLCKTAFAFTFFITGAIGLTIAGFILIRLIPFRKKQLRVAFHSLLSKFTWMQVYVMANIKKTIINKRREFFLNPHVIISNHQGFIDILVTTMQHPKIILLTNKWVWKSPVFGAVVRMADYYPVMEGFEGSIERLRKRAEEGYSIVIFPEGTRSPDGKLKRFHRGAFYLAEKLDLPILPLLIHGTGETIRKGDYYLNDAFITLKFLNHVEKDDTSFGETYSERAKNITRYFKQEFSKLRKQCETPAFFRYQLINNYLYKGPVLEWYLKIKLRLEKNYEFFDRLIPPNAKILDLGCGYGFMCYMLHFCSEERSITGIDYDEDKIATANHCYSKTDRIHFECGDVTSYPIESHDVIILSDVLHYLEPTQQLQLLEKSMTALNPGGSLIVRDGNPDLKSKHWRTVLTEFFSVRLLRFNKSVNDMNFISSEMISQVAERYNFETQVIPDSKITSNVFFVLKKKQQVHA